MADSSSSGSRCKRVLQPLNAKGQAFEGVSISTFMLADWQNKLYITAETAKKKVLFLMDYDTGALDVSMRPVTLLAASHYMLQNRQRIYFCDGEGIQMGLRVLNTSEEVKKGKLKVPYVKDRNDNSYLEAEVCEITDRRIYSTNEKKITLYNNEDPEKVEMIRVLVGQEEKISAFVFLIDRLYVGCKEGEMGQWSKNGEKLKIWKGHKGGVTSICTDGEVIFSASKDKTVKIWSKTCDLLHEFTVDTVVTNITVAKGVIYLGTDRGQVYVCNAKGDIIAKFVPSVEPSDPKARNPVHYLAIHNELLLTVLPPYDAIHEWNIKDLENLNSSGAPETHKALPTVSGTPALEMNFGPADKGCNVM